MLPSCTDYFSFIVHEQKWSCKETHIYAQLMQKLAPSDEGAGKTEGLDWGSVLPYDRTLPPSLPECKATSLTEGGKASKAYSEIILGFLSSPIRSLCSVLDHDQCHHSSGA